MKFGKELKIKSIPAWRDKYMSYKRLKRVITRLAMQMKEQKDREEKAELHDGLDDAATPVAGVRHVGADGAECRAGTP
jgi:phosphate transporter